MSGNNQNDDDLKRRLREHNDDRLYLEADELMCEAADRIKQLEAERDELKAALHKQVAHDKAVSYERCLDCDWPNRCTRETGCLGIKDHSPIANAALSK